MHHLLRPAIAFAMTIVLGACGSGTTTSPAASAAPTTASAPSAGAPSAGAPSAAGGAGSAAAACAVSPAGTAPTVTVTIKDFAYSPDPVTAKVGDVIGWMNNDTVPHTATLDDGTCTTDPINVGTSGALTFSAPGTYTYHCNIHPAKMTGTITITG